MPSLEDLLTKRGMPAAIETEMLILGSILNDNGMYYQAAEKLTEHDFLLDSHRRTYAAISSMMNAGTPVDFATLAEELNKRGQLSSIGGRAFLAGLTEGIPRQYSIARWVDIVVEKSMLREVFKVGDQLMTDAVDQSIDPREIIAQADLDLLAIAAAQSEDTISLVNQVTDTLREIDEQRAGAQPQMITTGISGLDIMTGGMPLGELTVLGAWPAQGKTAFLIQLLVRNGYKAIPSHFFSIEMNRKQVMRRLLAQVAGIPFHFVRHPERMRHEQYDQLRGAAVTVSTWPLIIDDNARSSSQIIARARVSKRRQNTEFVAIDYLQKMQFSGDPKSRHIDVTDACVACAHMAKNENLAVLLLSSLTEKAGKGAGEAPTMHDLRQSGDIQFEASNILLLHRKPTGEANKLDTDGALIVAKARNDETGSVPIHFNSDSLTFEEIVSPMYAQ